MNKNLGNDSKRMQLRWGVILFSTILFGAAIIYGLIDSDGFYTFFSGLFVSLLTNGGWFVNISVLLFLFFMVFFLFHPAGKIKFGGPDAKPEFTKWEWFSISICAGVGVGLLMWPGAEVIQLLVAPAIGSGLEAGSQEAALWSMAKVLLHWTFAPYAIYIVTGIVVGYVFYNLGRSFTVGAGLYPLLGPAAEGRLGRAIDAITVFALIGGVAGTFGYGILQIGSGLEYVFGLQPSMVVWIGICVVIVLSFLASSISGIYRGIRKLSTTNMYLFIFLVVFAFIFGPTAYMLNLGTESTGYLVNNFVSLSTFTDPWQNDLWPQWWDQYWMVDWASFAPILGIFLARAAYGRTIRQFVKFNFLIPALFSLFWFCVFSSFAVYLEVVQGAGLGDLMSAKGMEVVTLRLLDFLPLVDIVRPIFLITLFISFITLADSMTSTISMLSVKDFNLHEQSEAPIVMKVFWGVLIGATSMVFMFGGGIDGLKVVKTLAGYPILILQSLMVIGFLFYYFRKKPVFEGFRFRKAWEKMRAERKDYKARREAAMKDEKNEYGTYIEEQELWRTKGQTKENEQYNSDREKIEM